MSRRLFCSVPALDLLASDYEFLEGRIPEDGMLGLFLAILYSLAARLKNPFPDELVL